MGHRGVSQSVSQPAGRRRGGITTTISTMKLGLLLALSVGGTVADKAQQQQQQQQVAGLVARGVRHRGPQKKGLLAQTQGATQGQVAQVLYLEKQGQLISKVLPQELRKIVRK